jgi:hypothetical protein
MQKVQRWTFYEPTEKYVQNGYGYGGFECEAITISPDMTVTITILDWISRNANKGHGYYKHKYHIRFAEVISVQAYKVGICHNSPMNDWLEPGKSWDFAAFKITDSEQIRKLSIRDPESWGSISDSLVEYYIETIDDIIYEIVTAIPPIVEVELLQQENIDDA